MPASPEQLPFKEAIDFFKNKIRLPSAGYTDVWQQQHSVAFVVASAQTDALLADFYSALKNSHENGTGYAAFQQEFDAIAARNKWAYNGTPGWRSRVIYDTNMTQSYNAGRWQQMWDLRDLRPYVRYRHTSIEHPRLAHKAWDGLVLPIGDPWLDTHAPQNGYGCKCRLDSLSRGEAEANWTARGRTGPDEAPPIEWEEVTVGKKSATPRTVLTPKGVDPGFAYNPGKAYLEPHTVPPLQGYEKPLQERARSGANVSGLMPPPVTDRLRRATKLAASVLLEPPLDPVQEVSNFLDVFGATLDEGSVFIDPAGSPIAISKALFVKGTDKTGDNFKWMADERKADRLPYLNLLAMTIADPDEIWWEWEPRAQTREQIKRGDPKEWVLKRRYLKAFDVEGKSEYGIAAFTWGRDGWSGSTVFRAKDSERRTAESYFDDQRRGRLVHSRK